MPFETFPWLRVSFSNKLRLGGDHVITCKKKKTSTAGLCMYGLYKSLCGNYAKLVEKGVEIYQKHSKQFLEHNRLVLQEV